MRVIRMTDGGGIGSRARAALVCPLFLCLVTVVAHVSYSWMGFNPTDEGFILAYSRRILDGQIPHLDFISIHATGSAFVHMPFVAFGGDQTFWLSRLFAWFEFACIGWAWAVLAERLLEARFTALERASLAIIGIVFSSHYFPIMAWNTVDGLFCVSVGLAMCCNRSARWRIAGILMIALAYLCKQNFALIAPAAIVAFGDRRRPLAWLAAALPGVVYFAGLALAGALPDALAQLTARTEFIDAGVMPYLWEYTVPWGLLLGYLLVRMAHPDGAPAASSWRPSVAASAAVYGLLVAASLAMTKGQFLWAPSFGLVGLAAGAAIYFLTATPRRGGPLALALLAALTAWSASLSYGYNTPALATGPLAVVMLGFVHPSARRGAAFGDDAARRIGVSWSVAVMALAALVSINHWIARHDFVYLDRPSAELVAPLDGVFAGAQGISTNARTAAFLVDLDRAIGLAAGRPVVILPDLAAYWVTAETPNRLPIDWPLGDILIAPVLIDRVTQTIGAQRAEIVVIVQKVRANALARDFVPLPDSHRYVVVRHVRETYDEVAETRFFTLYE